MRTSTGSISVRKITQKKHPEWKTEINDSEGRDNRDHNFADNDAHRYNQTVGHHLPNRNTTPVVFLPVVSTVV
jgi:hypothetical protein